MDEDTNQVTLKAYENGLKEYNEATEMVVIGHHKAWLDKALSLLAKDAKILEIGSAHGRDADYIESQGFNVDRSDAAKSFVNYLKSQGYDARLLNVITNELGGPYDMVYANAVLLHFNLEETKVVLAKIIKSLKPGGLFVFSVKVGEGSRWSDAKLKDPRFFIYWQAEPLKKVLRDFGFNIVDFDEGKSDHTEEMWYRVIVKTPLHNKDK